MTHLWVRAEQRADEKRVGLTPEGAKALRAAGHHVTVETCTARAIPTADYQAAGCEIVAHGLWPDAPPDAVIFGLKELPEDGTPLPHRHIMFGHAYKGQPAGQLLLARLRAGGGKLYDLEALTDETGRRLAAFGYWAGYAGAAVTLLAWCAQQEGGKLGKLHDYPNRQALLADLAGELGDMLAPNALVIGALGRVGTGATDCLQALGVHVTKWDIAETRHGGPYPEILAHDLFLNCILAGPGCPVFIPANALQARRHLRVIGDVACDPTSDFSPIKVYDQVTDWTHPVRRLHDAPILDVMAIDNLPSLLPREASEDFAAQLLPSLLALDRLDQGVWGRAGQIFDRHIAAG